MVRRHQTTQSHSVTTSGDTASRHCLQHLDIFVLAGGLGTRIRPILGDVPKLLAPINGRPYLEFLLSWLQHFGARRIVLGLGHQSGAIIKYVRAHSRINLKISAVIEQSPLGTAGAIRFARGELHTDPVLVMNGDSFVDADLCQFLAHYRRVGTRGSILCANVADAGRYGRVLLDDKGYVCGFKEKDSTFHDAAIVNAGVYLISAKLLDEIAAGEAKSLERDVFERLPAGSLAAFTKSSKFIDIGTQEFSSICQ